jgi:hypothetical protein
MQRPGQMGPDVLLSRRSVTVQDGLGDQTVFGH